MTDSVTKGVARLGFTGVRAALLSVMVLCVATLPARMQLLLKGWGPLFSRLQRVLGGALLDSVTAVAVLAPLVVAVTLVLPVFFARLRGPKYQQIGAAVVAIPFGFAVWLLTVIAQEVKSERGSFPTLFDLSEGFGNASFVQGAVDFIFYTRIYLPAIATALLLVVLFGVAMRFGHATAVSFRVWSLALLAGAFLGYGVVFLAAFGLQSVDRRFGPAAIGDPLTGLSESAFDMLRRKGASTPRDLVLEAEFPFEMTATGAALMGWPPSQQQDAGCIGEAPQRSLDVVKNQTPASRGAALVNAFEHVSQALFAADTDSVAVFFLSLEGFRADDIHGLNDAAPAAIAPFTTSLYQRSAQAGNSGVLTSNAMYQAGVRTAHCLGAMTCGVGTLPYNLSFIRDLQPLSIRCASDVLAEAKFEHTFLYGSDGHFDEMDSFFKAHHYAKFLDQTAFPADAPKGTWNGVTDFAVFDAAIANAAQGLKAGQSQFSFVMSLSNHSPFTLPTDLPTEVQARVTQTLATVKNRADADDVRRVVTHAYTDEALKRFFDGLEKEGLADHSIVMLMADHSTGHNYLWGDELIEDDNAKSRIPFAVVIPERFRAKVAEPGALRQALEQAQAELNAGLLSQNDVPTLLLALLKHHPGVKALPQASRWHSMGGQVTSPFFVPPAGASIVGINGVSELFALDAKGNRVGDYQDSVFLKTRADRYRVTPMLIPAAARLSQAMQCSQ